MTKKHALSVPALPAISDSLSAYINAVNKLPLLSAQEEHDLAVRLREQNDTEAARRLVLANLRLVVAVSRKYNGYGLNQSDLIQEGNIGLMKAVRKFDPTRSARLATFAMYWIKAEIQEFIIKNWRIVKIATTKAQRKLFFNKHRLLQKNSGGAESDAAIAEELGVRAEEVANMRERLHNTDTVALVSDDEDNPGAEVYLADDDAVADPEAGLEMRDRRQALTLALEDLGERERDIIQGRRLEDPPLTLQELAKKHGISIERVRQIENGAISKMADRVRSGQSVSAG